MSHPVIGFAHRGAPRTGAEQNTLPAFERALSLGATGLESDISLAADGAPILEHVRMLRRSTPGGPPLSLAELYRQCGNQFELSLDMAEPEAAEAVVRTAIEHDALDHLWLTYWRLPVLVQWRDRWPSIHLVYATLPRRPGGAASLLDHLAAAQIDALNIYYSFCRRGLVELAHQRRLLIFAWGLRSARPVPRLQARGVDGLFCDDVAGMIDVLNR